MRGGGRKKAEPAPVGGSRPRGSPCSFSPSQAVYPSPFPPLSPGHGHVHRSPGPTDTEALAIWPRGHLSYSKPTPLLPGTALSDQHLPGKRQWSSQICKGERIGGLCVPSAQCEMMGEIPLRSNQPGVSVPSGAVTVGTPLLLREQQPGGNVGETIPASQVVARMR